MFTSVHSLALNLVGLLIFICFLLCCHTWRSCRYWCFSLGCPTISTKNYKEIMIIDFKILLVVSWTTSALIELEIFHHHTICISLSIHGITPSRHRKFMTSLQINITANCLMCRNLKYETKDIHMVSLCLVIYHTDHTYFFIVVFAAGSWSSGSDSWLLLLSYRGGALSAVSPLLSELLSESLGFVLPCKDIDRLLDLGVKKNRQYLYYSCITECKTNMT